MTLVQSISRNITMPTCGDSCECEHGRFVVTASDYSNPERPVLTFIKVSPQAAVLPAPMPERDPAVSREIAHQLGDFEDAELRAECERRFGHQYGARDVSWEKLVAEANRQREHWKTVAESAAAERDALKADLDAWKSGKRSLLRDFFERGPGIAATKPDNSVAWLDEDLLCDDADSKT